MVATGRDHVGLATGRDWACYRKWWLTRSRLAARSLLASSRELVRQPLPEAAGADAVLLRPAPRRPAAGRERQWRHGDAQGFCRIRGTRDTVGLRVRVQHAGLGRSERPRQQRDRE